jgi:hypothetical protein
MSELTRHEKRPRSVDARWAAGAVAADPVLSSPGFFKTKSVKGGAHVPARLWKEEDRDDDGDLTADVRYFAEIDGAPCDPFQPPHWPWIAITEAEWQFMTADAAWARENAPDLPIANPTLPSRALDPAFF